MFLPINIESSITLEMGLLAIFAIFFSFLGIKSSVLNEIKQKLIEYISLNKKKLAKDKIDFIKSKMSEIENEIKTNLRKSGTTFILCIFIGIIALIILLLNELIVVGWVEYLFWIIVLLQLVGLTLNLLRYRKLYELDLDEEINTLEELMDAWNNKDYSILNITLKK